MPPTDLLQYVTAVYRFALRLSGDHHEAEDLAQETLLRGWRDRGRLRDHRATRTWLFRIAANLWRDRLRRRQHRVTRAGPIGDDLENRDVSVPRLVCDQDEVRRAVAALDGLPPRQREVLYLHACEGLSHQEIADVLSLSGDAVKAHLSLARRRMRELFQEARDRHE